MTMPHLPSLARWRHDPDENPTRGLHRFSENGLHSLLLAALLVVAALAVVEAISVGVVMWRLEPVVITGKATPPTPSAPPALLPPR